MPDIEFQSIRVPVSDEDIVDVNELRRGMFAMLGIPYTPAFTDEQVAAAQARIEARREEARRAWAALPLRTRIARRARGRWLGLGWRVHFWRESAALRIAPWLRGDD